MKNDLFSIGPLTIHGYGLMIAIGVLAAYYTVEYRSKKRGMDENRVFSLAIWAVLGGFLGAKVLYLITELPAILREPSMIWNSFENGFVVYGGILGGIFGGWIYCRRAKWDFLKVFDLVAPSLALAQGFGRIGCFLAGCCYGHEVSASNPIAIVFHDSAYAPNNVPLIPTQLISSLFNFVNCAVLFWLSRRLKREGQVAGCYLIFYSVGRFIIEFFRGDLIRGSVGVLSTSQFISIFTLLGGLLLTFAYPALSRRKEASAPQEEEK
ncbi:MAG: prolipoprotein diacylglyceryl transferase [Eubacteriales bacterium]|nr:prolipoprotein diacylglyceryl transferase [Eubacteriales bacterium]